jgi:hypothetical protein
MGLLNGNHEPRRIHVVTDMKLKMTGNFVVVSNPKGQSPSGTSRRDPLVMKTPDID